MRDERGAPLDAASIAGLFAQERIEHARRTEAVDELEGAILELDDRSAAFARKVSALKLCRALGAQVRFWRVADALALAPTARERLAAWDVLRRHLDAAAGPAEKAA